VSCVDTMEVEEAAATDERLAAATPRDMPYPISEEERLDGWDTLINKCWLQCADCNRWRNAPKAIRDEVRVGAIALHAQNCSDTQRFLDWCAPRICVRR
jgi:hypothetical protein